MTTILTHHDLTAEAIHDKQGDAILLTQDADGFNEPNTVLVHPWQLRAVCEQFGIIASDPQAAKTIATLQRRMLGLHERIQALVDWMAAHTDYKHADLTHETAQLLALLDLANEWVADFQETGTEGAALPVCKQSRNEPPFAGFADSPGSTDQPSLI
jgi:hypothetical protein